MPQDTATDAPRLLTAAAVIRRLGVCAATFYGAATRGVPPLLPTLLTRGLRQVMIDRPGRRPLIRYDGESLDRILNRAARDGRL